jgi:phosphoketolase
VHADSAAHIAHARPPLRAPPARPRSLSRSYLRANPLLREPLHASHIKARLLGHWGTCPGLNLIYAHLNQ